MVFFSYFVFFKFYFIIFLFLGPDPYYFRGKTMFNNKNGHTGYSSSASKFRNFQNEAYGGPFGRFTCSLLCKDIVKNV